MKGSTLFSPNAMIRVVTVSCKINKDGNDDPDVQKDIYSDCT